MKWGANQGGKPFSFSWSGKTFLDSWYLNYELHDEKKLPVWKFGARVFQTEEHQMQRLWGRNRLGLCEKQYWGWSGVECPWGGAGGMKWEVGEIEAKFYRDLLAMVRNLDFSLNAEECYLENFKQRNRMIWSGLLFQRSTRLEWIIEWGWSCKERPPLCAGVMERVRLDGFWRYGHLNLLMWRVSWESSSIHLNLLIVDVCVCERERGGERWRKAGGWPSVGMSPMIMNIANI